MSFRTCTTFCEKLRRSGRKKETTMYSLTHCTACLQAMACICDHASLVHLTFFLSARLFIGVLLIFTCVDSCYDIAVTSRKAVMLPWDLHPMGLAINSAELSLEHLWMKTVHLQSDCALFSANCGTGPNCRSISAKVQRSSFCSRKM